ncbi:MAG: PLP-dependent transferase, partial [Actinomycetota bacterium]
MGDAEQTGELAGFSTRAIHAGQEPEPTTGAVVTPISLSTTFAQDGVGNHKGYEYARSGNPTRTAVETQIAALEQARHGLSFASGLAAEDNILRLVPKGKRVLLGNDAYGGTFRLIANVWSPQMDSPWSAVDLTDLDGLRADWPGDTAMIWLETPTNPLLTCFDIEAIAGIAHERGAVLVADNTFATPYLQQPLTLGADLVVHSATKYLGGHSDVVGGFVAANDDEMAERIRFTQNAAGAVPAPFDCYLVLRGVKTLAVRMQRHCENARAVVDHRALRRFRHLQRRLRPPLAPRRLRPPQQRQRRARRPRVHRVLLAPRRLREPKRHALQRTHRHRRLRRLVQHVLRVPPVRHLHTLHDRPTDRGDPRDRKMMMPAPPTDRQQHSASFFFFWRCCPENSTDLAGANCAPDGKRRSKVGGVGMKPKKSVPAEGAAG